MKSLFTLLFAIILSLSLMGQQDTKELKDIKELMDLKEQRYAKKHRVSSTDFPSRDYPRQFIHKQVSSLKAGNASEQKMDSLLWELYDAGSSSWALSDRELFTYDSKGNMTTYVWFVFDSVEMKMLPFDKETVKHDDAGNPTEIIWLIWDNESSQWLNWGKFLISYDGEGNLIQEIISDWDPDGNQWLEGAQLDMSYDVEGNQLSETWTVWDEDSAKLVPAYKEEYLYEDGKLTSINEYGWEEGVWVLFFRTTYTYDSSGNLNEELTQAWDSDGEVWIDFGKTLYTYNENDKLILEEVWEFSWTQFIVARTWQYTYVWDSDGNMTESVDMSWDEGSTKGTNSWQNSVKSEWTFNKDFTISDIYAAYWFFQDITEQIFVHMPVSETGYVYVDGDWVMDFRQSAYYSDFGASTGIEDREETSLKIFPVPASETLTINWDDSYSNLRFELYDLTGKRVILRAIDNNETIGVNHLSEGIYLYKLSNNNQLIYSGKISIR